MSVKDKLQIMIVTFNRDLYLKRTLEQLVNSPISDCDITIFDNKSSANPDLHHYKEGYWVHRR